MLRRIAGLSLIVLASCFVQEEARGHGGQYRGPGDTVPPNLGGGGDITPPGNPGAPGTTPGPGVPSTGRGGQPGTGGPIGPTGVNPGQGRPTTGQPMRRRTVNEGYERWEFWWEHNKAPFLQLKSRLGNRVVATVSPGFLTGRGSPNAAISTNRPTSSDVKNRLLPAMLPLLQETHPDIVDSAVLGSARMVRPEDASLALERIVETLAHSATTARESAALALGVLGSADGVEHLVHLMTDSPEGRRLVGRSQGVEDRVRAFAAASLGMIGDPKTVDALKAVIDDPRLRSKSDLQAMAIAALGLMPARHEEIVPFLKGLMTERGMNRIVRAQAPIALGKLKQESGGSVSAESSLVDVVELFEDDKTDNDLLRSLACCIGMLAEIDDDEAVEALMNAVRSRNDDQTRHFSIMSLAQIAGRDAMPQDRPELHQRIESFFLTELVKPRRVGHKPYAALALAVYARPGPLQEQGVARRVADKILEAFQDSNNPSYQGAMAVALGLLDHAPAKPQLLETFKDSHHQPLKGYIALALGMLRADQGAEFRSLIRQRGLEFKFRLQLARALGLMGDVQAVDTLVASLRDAETVSETSACAQALGLIGDRSALDELLLLVEDARNQALTRGFACVALGIIAEKTDLPWNARFTVNSNYRAKVPALAEILDIL